MSDVNTDTGRAEGGSGVSDSGQKAAPTDSGKGGAGGVEANAELESLKKQVADLEKQRGTAQSEAAAAKKQAEQLQSELLSKLVDAQSARDSANTQVATEDLIKRIDDEGGAAILDVFSTLGTDLEKELIGKTEAQKESIKKEVQAIIDERLMQLSPEFQENKQTVKILTDLGLDTATAMKVLKAVKPEVQNESGGRAAGSTGSYVASDTRRDSGLSEGAVNILKKALGATPEELAAVGATK